MDIRFKPTLQVIAYSRAARGILYTFDLERLKWQFMSRSKTRFDDYVQQMEEKVFDNVENAFQHVTAVSRSKNERCLEVKPKVTKQLAGVAMTLALEVKNWYQCHRHILRASNLYLRRKLIWFSFGIIDRFKTAQNFVQDEKLDIFERFHLACKYYFESDLKMLWENMSVDNKAKIKERVPDRSLEIHLRVLQRNGTIDWDQLSLTERTGHFFTDNCMGLRYYFPKLKGRIIKSRCIDVATSCIGIHHFDLYSCLSGMEMYEINYILGRLKSSNVFVIFNTFLHWPLQNMFLNFAINFMPYIGPDVFHDLIQIMLFEKIEIGWQDSQYIDLLKSLCMRMPAKYVDHIKKDTKNYSVLKRVLKNPRPFNLEEYRRYIDNYRR
ncbi:uncharacterized protein TNIN_437271 [Trichonephila inaurata madagascariensis]|uniref:Uncharacterized protein n=1 Tax=Trichonephila inaurata madagascariensis TaxID=2747483 RepID=A0A8X6WZ47_9ARAC|nr:uncharacterized protein TNIN_344451 [Trichonephila inaurata madagascariensis]GFY43227.1 uncharacterized protein TNIN_437271 [Trichonephila inaurata madagascariensis]